MWTERLKGELAAVDIKKQCCRRALMFGMLFSSKRTDGGDVILSIPICASELARRLIKEQFTREPEDLGRVRGRVLFSFNSRAARIMLEKQADYSEYIKCPGCASHILRGIFLAVGSMNSPDKECYLQLSPADVHAAFAAKELGEACGIQFFTGERRQKTYLYAKRREVIEQMLGELGANNAYFDFINAGIGKQTRGDANRASNCITSNISKTVAAAQQITELIRSARELDRLSVLPPELAETAILRLEHPDSSLSALAAMHVPPVSKSGLYHRLEKITEILEEDRKKYSK